MTKIKAPSSRRTPKAKPRLLPTASSARVSQPAPELRSASGTTGWPQGQVESKIAEHLKAGRRVFLDADPRWWLPCSWHVSEIEELAKIEPHFHFKKVAPTIYEIRPPDDRSAADHPNLEDLLPEKRTDEVKKCFNEVGLRPRSFAPQVSSLIPLNPPRSNHLR